MRAHHVRLHRLLRALCSAALFSLVASTGSQELSVRDVQARIEGVYVLQEWRRNGETFRPPLVDARSVLLDGRIVFVAHDHARTGTKTTLVGYGTYSLEPGKFSYGYERWLTVTRDTNGTSVSDEIFAGPREFAVKVERDGIRFKAIHGPYEFRFTQDGQSYSDGVETRLYRRVVGQ